MKQTVGQRLVAFAKAKNMTVSSLEKTCGFSNGYLSNLKNSPAPDKLSILLEALPDLNLSWLMLGEGPMINENAGETEKKETQAAIVTVDGDSIPEEYTVPLVPMAAMAGDLSGFDAEGVDPRRCEWVISPIKGADMAVPVYGDSMEPEYPSGSRVLVKQVDPTLFIEYGQTFVLDTLNGVLLKAVHRSDRSDCLRCVSLNPSGRYQPFDVPLSSIRGLYRVLACVSPK